MSTKFVACLGHSQTDETAAFGVNASDMWPGQTQRTFRARGKDIRCRNFGKSGDTSAQALARVADCFYYETQAATLLNKLAAGPLAAVIDIGVNDPGAAISTAQTQANIQAIIKALKFKAIGDGLSSGPSVAGQANLPANGAPGQRYVVLADTSTTGGAPAWDTTSQKATITGSVAADANGQKQTVWEWRSNAAAELGWGRIATNATVPTHVQRIIVLSTNYLNFTSGASGDQTGTPFTTNATLRGAQQAAVTAEDLTVNALDVVVYGDLYTLQRTLIVGGTVNGVTYSAAYVPDFFSNTYDQTKSWHWAQDNQHHSGFGHQLVAQTLIPLLAPVVT